MNAEQLLAHYEKIADAPDAIARLRRFVLDLAVRGKLVAQVQKDEPASELVMRVANEKAKAMKEGRFREPKSFVKIPRTDLPFSPADHWEWVRLIDVAQPSYGFAFPSSKFNAAKRGMPLIRIRDISRTDTEAYFEGEFDATYLVKARDYLVGMDGDFNLRRWVGVDALLNQRVMRLNGWRCGVEPEFIKLPLQLVLDHLHGETSLTTVKHLSAKQVNGIEIPLPPLAEQHRIVTKVDELMALCDQLEKSRSAREETRNRLAATSLARLNDPAPETFQADARFALDALPSMTARPDQIKQLRQTILNLAVLGKLVPQNPNDEPASDLLARIAAERTPTLKSRATQIKKHLPREAVEEAQTLPESWKQISLGDVCHLVTSGSRGWAEYYSASGSKFIRAQNIRFGELKLEDLARVNPPRKSEGSRTRLATGDLLIVITGAGVTNSAVLDRNLGEAYISQHVGLVRPVDPQLSKWLLLCLMANAGGRSELVERAYGAGRPGLNLDNIRMLRVPLAPIAEQERIAAKVDELMGICDRLEESLTTGETIRSKLLDAMLHEALEPSVNQLEAAA